MALKQAGTKLGQAHILTKRLSFVCEPDFDLEMSEDFISANSLN